MQHVINACTAEDAGAFCNLIGKPVRPGYPAFPDIFVSTKIQAFRVNGLIVFVHETSRWVEWVEARNPTSTFH